MDERITLKSDVYSFAIMMWEVATRMHPWHKMSALAVTRKVVDEGLRPTVVPLQQVSGVGLLLIIALCQGAWISPIS